MGDLIKGSKAKELEARSRIAEAFLGDNEEVVYHGVLQVLLDVFDSKFGVMGYIDENGAYVVPSMTRHIWDQCQVEEKRFVFLRDEWGDSTWPRAIRERRIIYRNEPSTVTPEGHITIDRHVSAPIVYGGEAVGLFQVANKETDYGPDDIRLAENICNAIAPILNARLQRDRVEKQRKAALEQVRQLNEHLERSNKELERFAYVASHDLQEPLRKVRSFIELLELDYGDRLVGEAKQYMSFIMDGAERMQNLIRNLLALSRVSASRKRPRPTDGSEVLRRVLDDLRLHIEESGASVTVGPLPTVLADRSQLERLFRNLIGNAIKFRGDAPPRVHVTAKEEPGRWVFEVRDNGIGFDPEYAHAIFDMFRRLHGPEKYSGTGIGLAICRKIVELHGGEIGAESKPGKGSTFHFSLRSAESGEPQDSANPES